MISIFWNKTSLVKGKTQGISSPKTHKMGLIEFYLNLFRIKEVQLNTQKRLSENCPNPAVVRI